MLSFLEVIGCQQTSNAERPTPNNRTSAPLNDELLAGSPGSGDDLIEARIAAQIIPTRIESELAVRRAVRDRRDFFELLERAVAFAGPA